MTPRLLERRRRSLRWRLRHENPRRLTKPQYLTAEREQKAALEAASRSERVPWPHETRRRRPPMQPAMTCDEMAGMLNHQLLSEAGRRG